MKILFFTDILRAGGKERRIIELIKSLIQQGILCEIVVMSRDIQYPLIYQLGIPIHFMTYKIKKDPSPFWRFYKLCKSVKPDIVHSWSPMCTYYALPTVKSMGIKIIINQIVNSPGYIKPFSKNWFANNITFPFVDMIVANSNAGLKDYHPPIHKSLCIHNGFDFARIKDIKDIDVIRKLYNVRTPFVVCMVASMGASKDYDSYFQAAQLILKKRHDITFLAVGDGPNKQSLQDSILVENLSYIRFLGKQTNVEEIMNICNIGVLSTYTEGISNAILEFMALGKPVIATDGGGTNEIISDGKTGFLVPPRSPQRIAEKIEFLLENLNEIVTMGTAGKIKVEQEFSLDRMNRDFIALYEQLLSGNKKRM
jgi:glycosyltransferase involved in cell wall biosynthesis